MKTPIDFPVKPARKAAAVASGCRADADELRLRSSQAFCLISVPNQRHSQRQQIGKQGRNVELETIVGTKLGFTETKGTVSSPVYATEEFDGPPGLQSPRLRPSRGIPGEHVIKKFALTLRRQSGHLPLNVIVHVAARNLANESALNDGAELAQWDHEH